MCTAMENLPSELIEKWWFFIDAKDDVQTDLIISEIN